MDFREEFEQSLELIWSPAGSIRDPIYGSIPFTERLRNFLNNCVVFQRLRYIKQLGFAYLVFPSANHTRFEHSLGVWYLTKKIIASMLRRGVINIKEREARIIEAAALLHDIGHLPFSHELEEVHEIGSKYDHREIGRQLILGVGKAYRAIMTGPKSPYKGSKDIKSVLTDNRMGWGLKDKDLVSVANIVCEKPSGRSAVEKIGNQIVNGVICADRIDNLMRDVYHTGINFQFVEFDRLINSLEIDTRSPQCPIVLNQKGVRAVEMMITGRFVLYTNVYWHHTVRAARALFKRGLEEALRSQAELVKKGPKYKAKKSTRPETHHLTPHDILFHTDESLLLHMMRVYKKSSLPYNASFKIHFRTSLYKRGRVIDSQDMEDMLETRHRSNHFFSTRLLELITNLAAFSKHRDTGDRKLASIQTKVSRNLEAIEDEIVRGLCTKVVKNKVLRKMAQRIKEMEKKYDNREVDKRLKDKEIVELKNAIKWYRRADLNPKKWKSGFFIIADCTMPRSKEVLRELEEIKIFDVEGFKSYQTYNLVQFINELEGYESKFSRIIETIADTFDKSWKFRLLANCEDLGKIVQVYCQDILEATQQ